MPEVTSEKTLFDPVAFVDYTVQRMKSRERKLIGFDTYQIPFLITRNKRFTHCESLPYSLYAPISDTTVLKDTLDLIGREKHDAIRINVGPFAELTIETATVLAKETGFDLRVYQCHCIDTTRDLDEIFSNFNDTRKKHIKRYLKAGTLKVFQTSDPVYFDKYYDIYLDSVRRWGETTPGYSREFIQGLYSVPGVRMWVAEQDGMMLSGMICIYYESYVFDWLAATLINDEVKKSYPAVAVQYEVIKHAVAIGLDHVNMGASNQLSGVNEFKNTWGAEEFKTFCFEKRSLLFKWAKRIIQTVKK